MDEKPTDNSADVSCLKCGRIFRSPDKRRIRRCPRCKENEGQFGRLGDGFSRAHLDPTDRHN